MGNDKDKNRLKALLAKALDDGATQAERDGAMVAAEKIMSRTGLDEDDVADSAGDTVGQTGKDSGKPDLHPVWRKCAVQLAAFCGVVVYRKYEKLVTVGAESDRDLFFWLIEHLTDSCEIGWNTYKASRMSRNMGALKDARIVYLRSFCAEVNKRVEDWLFRTLSADYRAMVDGKIAVARQHLASAGIGLHPAAQRNFRQVSDMGIAAGAGRNAGASVNLGRGVGNGTIRMIGR